VRRIAGWKGLSAHNVKETSDVQFRGIGLWLSDRQLSGSGKKSDGGAQERAVPRAAKGPRASRSEISRPAAFGRCLGRRT